jgi:hypothetical protein
MYLINSHNQVKENEMVTACSTHGEKSNTYRILVGKLEGKGPLRRPSRRREDNIKMDLRKTGWGNVN